MSRRRIYGCPGKAKTLDGRKLGHHLESYSFAKKTPPLRITPGKKKNSDLKPDDRIEGWKLESSVLRPRVRVEVGANRHADYSGRPQGSLTFPMPRQHVTFPAAGQTVHRHDCTRRLSPQH